MRAVSLREFTEICSQRCEHQFGADWSFSYVRWNILFRQMLQRTKTMSLQQTTQDEGGAVTAEHVCAAACEISEALRGNYLSSDGHSRPVAGNLGKVALVPGLSSLSQRLLRQVQYSIRRIPGTTGVRSLMRHRAQAMQLYYGTPLFVTLSPAEKHNWIMLKLARWRMEDPAVQQDPALQKVAARTAPEAGTSETWPTFEERRKILALKPSAAVIGFRVHVQLLLQGIFGLRTCLFCPQCQLSGEEAFCADLCGNGAKLEGGAFGRCVAGFFAIESQKAGALHVHGHVVLECLHQHRSLDSLVEEMESRGEQLCGQFLRFKEHVTMQTHAVPAQWTERKREEVETSWPEHAARDELLLVPEFFRARQAVGSVAAALEEAEVWKRQYMEDVEMIQELRQHHIHLPDKHGKRKPLPGCKKAGCAEGCRSGFPQEQQMTERGLVVCPGLGPELGLAIKGRRNSLGSLHGPRDCPWLNGSHPALLTAGRHNSDVQIGFRLPVCKATHSGWCGRDCCAETKVEAVQAAAQAAQAAQIGYSTDYAAKKQAQGLYECKAFARGHAAMAPKLRGCTVGQVSRRHSQRIVADCFVRGVVRGACETECLNMRAMSTEANPAAAETIQTFLTGVFPAHAFLDAVDRAVRASPVYMSKALLQVCGQEVLLRDLGTLYGLRGKHEAVRFLSPYEFVRGWHVVPASTVEKRRRQWGRVVPFPENSLCPTIRLQLGCMGEGKNCSEVFGMSGVEGVARAMLQGSV